MKMKDVEGRIFTFAPDDGSHSWSLSTTAMNEWLDKTNHPMVLASCDRKHALYLSEHGGVEPHRLWRLMPMSWDKLIENPITIIQTEQYAHVVADGNHRYLLASLHGCHWIPARVLSQEQWKPFLIEDAPNVSKDALHGSFSGID